MSFSSPWIPRFPYFYFLSVIFVEFCYMEDSEIIQVSILPGFLCRLVRMQQYFSNTYSEPCQASVVELLSKLVNTAQKMKIFIKDFFSKCDQFRSFLRIWAHLLKKSLIENFIFCSVKTGRQLFLKKDTQIFEMALNTPLDLNLPHLFKFVSVFDKHIY